MAEHRDRGDEHRLARDLGGLGTALLNLGDQVGARSLLEESLIVARRFDDRWSSAMSLTLLGHVYLADGDDALAQVVLAESAALFQATGNLMFLRWCLEGLAGVAAARGRFEQAAELDGARDALGAQIGVVLPPIHPAGYAQTLAAARAGLSREAFEPARAGPAHQAPQQIIAAVMSTWNSGAPKPAR